MSDKNYYTVVNNGTTPIDSFLSGQVVQLAIGATGVYALTDGEKATLIFDYGCTVTEFYPAINLSRTMTEGLNLRVIDQVVDFAVGAAAKYRAISPAIPAGAIIHSIQANIEKLVVSATTSVKVGIGPNGTDPNKYGITTDLTKNEKISTPLAPILSAGEQIDVCVCTSAGDIGGSNASAGKVRVHIVYEVLQDLDDAA